MAQLVELLDLADRFALRIQEHLDHRLLCRFLLHLLSVLAYHRVKSGGTLAHLRRLNPTQDRGRKVRGQRKRQHVLPAYFIAQWSDIILRYDVIIVASFVLEFSQVSVYLSREVNVGLAGSLQVVVGM